MGPARVLVVYGSETGNVRRGIHGCVRHWRAHKDHGVSYEIDPANVMSGNEVAAEFSTLVEVAHDFDVVVVATSSFGEGDPPANFVKFLLMLVRASNAELKPGRQPPLKGLQHCVIGYGQSVYATFQSCPRYVDQLLEKLGSRRMLQRVELDEGPDETIAAGMESDDFTTMGTGAGEVEQDVIGRSVPLRRFTAAVHEALTTASATADKPPPCPWTVPGAECVEKTVHELIHVRPQKVEDVGPPQWLKYALVAAVAAAATHYLPAYMEQYK